MSEANKTATQITNLTTVHHITAIVAIIEHIQTPWSESDHVESSSGWPAHRDNMITLSLVTVCVGMWQRTSPAEQAHEYSYIHSFCIYDDQCSNPPTFNWARSDEEQIDE